MGAYSTRETEQTRIHKRATEIPINLVASRGTENPDVTRGFPEGSEHRWFRRQSELPCRPGTGRGYPDRVLIQLLGDPDQSGSRGAT